MYMACVIAGIVVVIGSDTSEVYGVAVCPFTRCRGSDADEPRSWDISPPASC